MKFNHLAMLASTMLATNALVQPALAEAPASTPPAAEQPQTGVPEILVTAQRRSESLQKVPLSITAIGAVQLAQRGIDSLTNLSTSVTPGLEVTPYAGSAAQLTVSIRGVAAPDPGVGLNDLGVAIYEDGVPIGRSVGAGIDLGDIERIEVLRGPQGTLFGRNAEGGAIQYITKRPSGALDGKLEGDFGNYNAKRVLGQIDLPEFNNISIKLSGLINEHDGYTKNAPLRPTDTVSPQDHYDLGYFDQKAFRVAVLWAPTSNFSAYYSFDFANTDFTNAYQVRTGGPTPSEPAFCKVPSFGAFCGSLASIGANIYQNTRTPDTGYPKVTDDPLYEPLNTNHIRGNALTLDWKASPAVDIKSITGYRTLKEVSENNLGDAIGFAQFVPSSLYNNVHGVPIGTMGAVSGSVATANIDQSQFSEELQLLADIGDVKITAGLFYYHEHVIDTQSSLFSMAFLYLGTPGFLTEVSTNPFALQTNPITGVNATQSTWDAKADSYAAYSQATWSPSSITGLHLTGGLRYTHDKKFFDRAVFDGAPDGTTNTFSASRVDPAAIIAYDATPNVNVYGKYSSAYRAGGINIRDTVSLSPYGSEVNKTFEIGIKSQLFDHHVRFNAAGFVSRVTGTQTSEPDNPTNPSSQKTINLTSPVKFAGLEAELTISPLRDLALGANYAYLHASGPATQLTGAGLVSYTVPDAPKNQLQLTADYSVAVQNDIRLMAHIDYDYTSANYNTPLTAIPAFTATAAQTLHTTNIKLGFDGVPIGGLKFSIYGYARNLFNVAEYNFAYQTGTADFTVTQPGGAATYTDPRTFGVQLIAKF